MGVAAGIQDMSLVVKSYSVVYCRNSSRRLGTYLGLETTPLATIGYSGKICIPVKLVNGLVAVTK